MIKWRGTNKENQHEVLGFGLEEKNLEKLKEGLPIYVFGPEMNLPFDIVIYYGKDFPTLMDMSRNQIGSHTIIHDHRTRKKQ